MILNEDMTVAYQNPPSLALEVDPRRIAGENPLEYVHDDDVPRVAEDFRRALAELGRCFRPVDDPLGRVSVAVGIRPLHGLDEVRDDRAPRALDLCQHEVGERPDIDAGREPGEVL